MERIGFCAHRGYKGKYPENTLLAFEKALEFDIDYVELDVHITRDGEIVLMHDHTVDRTTDGHGFVRDLTLKEIKELDAGIFMGEEFKGEKVPTYKEFLELMSKHKNVKILLELKDYPSECGDMAYVSAEKAIQETIEAGLDDNVIINSFSGDILEFIDKKYDGKFPLHGYYPVNQLKKDATNDYYKIFKNMAYVCLFNKGGLSSKGNYPVCDKEHFDIVKSYGIKPCVYYSQETFEMIEDSVNYGATLITTNYIEDCEEMLKKLGKR